MSSENFNHSENREPGFLRFVEMGDGFAHVAVSILLLLLALGVLVMSTVKFVTDIIQDPASANFGAKGLDYLSGLLFGVIVLELLSTIITYVKARSLEATIKDFLVVAIISSIRKILLVGAQSSMDKTTGEAFKTEAIGTIITIVGIILLIGGLKLLNWQIKQKSETAQMLTEAQP